MDVIVFGKIVRLFDDDDNDTFRKLSVGDDFELLVPPGDDVELFCFHLVLKHNQHLFLLNFIELSMIRLENE